MNVRVLLGGLLIAGGALWTGTLAGDPLPKSPPIPKDNPMTPAKIELGKQLYFDPRLSKTGTVSCNSCHNVMAGGDDNRAVSVGVEGKKGDRSAPTVWNAAFMSVQFWDGRAATLEDQAKGPLVNSDEMGMSSHDLVVKRIAEVPGYQEEFRKVFVEKEPITIDNVAKAIAAYERTLITPNSPYDRYMAGDKNALDPAAKRGMDLAQKIGCTSCHSGPNFAGPALEPGQGFFMKFPMNAGTEYEVKYHLAEDPGRFKVTKQESDRNVWRVPTWRNITLTAPYFHNGSVATLNEAVRVMAKTQLGRDLNDAEASDLVAFMHGLTGTFPVQTMPQLPPTPTKSVIGE